MRITRGHYNRKLLTFGIMLFLGIALISTGFAAWIMSSGAELNYGDGSVTVGEITESDLEFTTIQLLDGTSSAILFEPAKDDKSGDIKWDGTNSENLSFKFTTTVSPADYLSEVQIKMSYPASVVAAHNAGYIVLPEAAVLAEGVEHLTILSFDQAGKAQAKSYTGITVAMEEVKNAEGTKVTGIKLTVTVSIAWGAKFYGQNPSISLDDKTHNLTSDQKKAELYAFKRMVYGLDSTMPDAEVAVYTPTEPIQYSITLIATVN